MNSTTTEWIERAWKFIGIFIYSANCEERCWLINNKPSVNSEAKPEADKYTAAFNKRQEVEKQRQQPDNTLTLHYEFKPCPFCGEPAILKIDKCTVKVNCAKCSYEMQASYTGHGYPEPNKIIEVLTDLSDRWNARA